MSHTIRERTVVAGDTRERLLITAEQMYVEHGHETMSLRQITQLAGTNLAAVNYYFRSKDGLVQAMLARRLDPINKARLAMLARFSDTYGDSLTCEHVFGAIVIPVLNASVDRLSASATAAFGLRAASDLSPFVRNFLGDRYGAVSERFFDAFHRALPTVAREELRWRLSLLTSASPGILVNANTLQLMHEGMGRSARTQVRVLAQLGTLLSACLRMREPTAGEIETFERMLQGSDMLPTPFSSAYEVDLGST